MISLDLWRARIGLFGGGSANRSMTDMATEVSETVGLGTGDVLIFYFSLWFLVAVGFCLGNTIVASVKVPPCSQDICCGTGILTENKTFFDVPVHGDVMMWQAWQSAVLNIPNGLLMSVNCFLLVLWCIRQNCELPTPKTIIALLLQLAGDVESNPGPPPTMENGNDSQNKKNTVSNEDILSDIRAMIREQSVMRQTMEDRFMSIEEKLSGRLREIEDTMEKTNSEVVKLCETVEQLSEENSRLREEISSQTEKMDKQDEKLDYMENQSRRQNLMFFNIPKEKQNETWEDCERLVQKVIKDFLQIDREVLIDRAHRVGRQIVARFQNFKDKDQVLKSAYKLKEQNTKIGISEDYSKSVRNKRKVLVGLMNEYRAKDQKAKLVFDKLYTPDGVFIVADPDTREIKKIGQSRGKGEGKPPSRSNNGETNNTMADYVTQQDGLSQSASRSVERHGGVDSVTPLRASPLRTSPLTQQSTRPMTRLFVSQHDPHQPRQQHAEDGQGNDVNSSMFSLRGFGRGTTPPNRERQETDAHNQGPPNRRPARGRASPLRGGQHSRGGR